MNMSKKSNEFLAEAKGINMLQRLSQVDNSRECALSVDFTVRSGTANIFTKQQQFRTTWVGRALSTTNLYLTVSNKGATVCGPFSTIILNCEYPVKVTYVEPSTGAIVAQTVRQLWIADLDLDQVVIESLSSINNAVVVTTLQKEPEDENLSQTSLG